MKHIIDNAHMPYPITYLGVDWLLYCEGEEVTHVFGEPYQLKRWKMMAMRMDTGETIRISPQFSTPHMECNPRAEHTKEGALVVTFTAAAIIDDEALIYTTYQMAGTLFENLADVTPVDSSNTRHFNGAASDGIVVTCLNSLVSITRHKAKSSQQVDMSAVLPMVYRVSFSNGWLLCTGADLTGVLRTYAYDADAMKLLGEIRSPVGPIYKSGILGDKVYFADKETYSIYADTWELVPAGGDLPVAQMLYERRQDDEKEQAKHRSIATLPAPRRRGARVARSAIAQNPWVKLLGEAQAVSPECHMIVTQIHADAQKPPRNVPCKSKAAYRKRMMDKAVHRVEEYKALALEGKC